MDTNPILSIYDATVLPTNPHQLEQKNSLEEPSIYTTFDEQAPHCTNQELKCRCSLGGVSIPTSSEPQTNESPSQYQTTIDLISCGYTSDEVIEALHIQHMVEEPNVIEIVQEDVQLPPSSFQQENEGQ